ERPAAHMDRLVCAASPPLVPRLCYRRHAGAGTRPGVHAVLAAALADRVLLHRYRMADSRNPHRELHLPELSGARAGIPPVGRPLLAADHAGAVANLHHSHSHSTDRRSTREKCGIAGFRLFTSSAKVATSFTSAAAVPHQRDADLD